MTKFTLNPCPTCGSTSAPELFSSNYPGERYVCCNYNNGGCGTKTAGANGDFLAAAKWNRRPIMEIPTARTAHDIGPWMVNVWDPKAKQRIVLQSDDFIHDAALEISGDFVNLDQKMQYATNLCARLNAMPGVRPVNYRQVDLEATPEFQAFKKFVDEFYSKDE